MNFIIAICSIAALLTLTGCGSAPDNPPRQTAALATDAHEEKKSETQNGSCCFQKKSDFKPFIPAGDALLTLHGNDGFTTNFNCAPTEEQPRSSASATYEIDAEKTKDKMYAKYGKLIIRDYCAKPADLASDIKRRRDNAIKYAGENSNITVEDIKSDGIYYGFTYQDITKGNNSQNVHLRAVAGERFLVHVSGIDHVRMDAVKQLFELIPLTELAEFRE